RGGATPADRPEDWVGSATPRFGLAPDGITRLPDGTLLADAIAADPVAWLGREHVARHGANPALLVKLLDAGQRLPVHVHPDRSFAAEHLASPYGKTEAWIVLEADPGAAVHLGFSRDVEAGELAGWVRDQDVTAMLGATNRVPVAAGDAVLCPAGTPHAIGAGILVVELQEPTDFSILLEWQGFLPGPDGASVGLPMDEALGCVHKGAWSAGQLGRLRGAGVTGASGSLLPAEADPFFVAERIGPGGFGPSYALLVVTAGAGTLVPESGAGIPVGRGATVLIPHSAGPCTLTGDVRAIRCCPGRA
ncbi:MAG: class I mannose-6-phosphate isomerase, partial [Trebonia sp.]